MRGFEELLDTALAKWWRVVVKGLSFDDRPNLHHLGSVESFVMVNREDCQEEGESTSPQTSGQHQPNFPLPVRYLEATSPSPRNRLDLHLPGFDSLHPTKQVCKMDEPVLKHGFSPSMLGRRDTGLSYYSPLPSLKRIQVHGEGVCPENSKIQVNSTLFKSVTPDDFLHLSYLGSGSFGRVDAMLHRQSGAKVAVKKMLVCDDDDKVDHMINEIKVLAGCCHEAIVNFFGYFLSHTELWLCLELMQSCFERILLNSGPVPESVIGKVTVSVVNALDYIKRELNLMHRDIKPSNILISSKGAIKICDFGISCPLINSQSYQWRGGCNAYLAPERINSSEPYDVRSDVWSLGVTLYELATAIHPYSPYRAEQCEFSLLTHVQEDKPPSLPWFLFSPFFCHFVWQCLRKDVTRRPKYNQLMNHWFYLVHKWRGQNHSRQVVSKWFAKIQPLLH